MKKDKKENWRKEFKSQERKNRKGRVRWNLE